MSRIAFRYTLNMRFYSTVTSKFDTRFTTPADREQFDNLLKRSFHGDKILIKMLGILNEETNLVYDRILSYKFTINNSFCAVNMIVMKFVLQLFSNYQ
uniref:Uncharacterized protein n=1 Tax=Strongyloides venezuelensis TaxID=75913 RepID=A0A0K0FWT6_STRVS